jgi:hypothetical protein
MHKPTSEVLGLLGSLGVSAIQSGYNSSGDFNLRPFTINLSDDAPRMIDLVNNTQLPSNLEYLSASAGIPLDTLKSLRIEWLTQFDWEKEQSAINA